MRFDLKKEFYSLRKFKGIGLASALVGLSFMSQGVLAKEASMVSSTSGGDLATVTNSSSESGSDRLVVVPKDGVVSSSTTEPISSPMIENKVEDIVQPSVVEGSSSVVKPSSEATTEVSAVSESVTEVAPVATTTNTTSSVRSSTPIFSETPLSSETAESSSKPKEVSENSSPSSTAVSTESSQPTRSRRGKRDVPVDNRVLDAFVDQGKKKEIPVSRLETVDKFDYTTSPNPSTANDGTIYNNYISKLEKIDGGSEGTQRYRLTLKDGDSLASGSKIVFAGVGFGSPISRDLVIGTEKVGTIDSTNSMRNENKLKDRLKATTKIDDYISIVEGLDRYDIPLSSLVVTFNKNFEKYDKNRVVEFALNKSSYTNIDSSLTTRTYISGFPDSNGITHRLLDGNKMTSYLLNPYDSSKLMEIGETTVYVSKGNLPSNNTPTNKVSASTAYTYVTKPFYFDTAYARVADNIYISNGNPNDSEPALKVGDTFKTTLSENSLFTPTSKYKVGDIVTLDVSDTPSRTPTVTGNRFTDSDTYVLTEPPTNKTPLYSKARFELVEKTDRGYTWKLLDDISVVNSSLYIGTSATLTPMELRSDWMERFGADNFKRYMTSNIRNAQSFVPKDALMSVITYNIKGVETVISSPGLIEKNTNLTVGDSTTGTVKVVHKTDTGTILKEESAIVTDQPWYTVVNIDPQQFEGYQFKSSTEILSTIAGKGERTIELIYAKPKEVVTKDPIKVKYVVDETKDGGYRNEVEGTATVRTTRTDYIYSPETRTATPKDTVTVVEGTPTVVTLGTKPTTEVTKQAFTTRYVADSERAGGEKFTETTGVEGTTTVTTTYSVNTETGIVNPTKGQPEVIAPKEEVVKVGTKTKTEVVSTPKGTVYQADLDAPYESRVTSVAGRDGSTTTTTTYTLNTTNGEVTPTTKVDKVEKEDTVIKIGNVRTEMETLPRTIDYVANSDIDFGKKELRSEGRDGEVLARYTYTVSPTDGSLSNPVRSVTEGDVGLMLSDTYEVGNKKQDRRETAITTRYEADPEKVRDEKETVFQGVLGVHTTTTIYKVNNTTGALSNPVVSETDIPMEPKVVKVGTKPTVETETIAITTKYVADDTLEFGKVVETEKGLEGRVVTTTTYTMNPDDGTTTANKPTVETTPMVQRVVKVGVKKKVVEVPIEFTTRYERDEEVEAGKKTPSVSGVAGKTITTTTYTMNPTTGVVTENPSTTVREEPTTAVVKVGTKPKVETEVLSKTTRYEVDPTKAKGETEVVEQGSNGSVVTTTPYVLNEKDGSVSEGKSTTVRTEPKERVIKVGTQPKVVVEKIEKATRYEANPTKPKGEKEISVEGSDGSITTTTPYVLNKEDGSVTEGTPIVERVSAVEKVVKVGTQPKVEETPLPFTTSYEADPSVDKGFTSNKVVGKDGKVTTTTTYSVDPKTGEVSENPSTSVREEPVNRVVSVGSKPTTVVTEQDYSTRYVEDSSKEVGFKETREKGVRGTTSVTTTYSVDSASGKVTPKEGSPVVVTPKEEVIAFGTKPKVEVEILPKTTRYEKDSEKDKGVSTTSVEGSDGSKTTTTTYTVNPKTGEVTPSTPIVETVLAVGKVVKVGAKDKVVVTPIPVEVEEVADPDLFEGDEKVTSKGKVGSTTTTTEYVVNPKTGEITGKDPVISTIPMEKKVVHKGTKKRKATVTISYVLKDNGSALGSPTVLENQQVGSPYNTSVKVFEPKVEVSELADRTITKTTSYVLEKEPENKSGIVTEQGVSVVYTYRALVREEVVMKESKLTVNFVLEGSGEKLHESLVKEGVRVGDPYVTEPLALKDKVEKRVERNKEVVTTTKYEIVETPNNARGLIEVGGTSVTFTYRVVVSSEEYPTIPSEAPKVDEVEYTEPIHINGPVEILTIPEFTGGVNPYAVPIYEKPELKVEEPVFTPIIGDSFPRKEVPAEVSNKVSDSEKEKPLSPREEKPSVDGLETPKQVLTSNSSQKPQNAPDSISISQVEKVTPNYQTSLKQAPSGSEQVLPNTGSSEADKLVSLSGIGLLGLLGLVGLRKSKEE